MTASQGKGKTAYMGLLLAFALILSYVESLIPFFFGIPGMKLGLANLAVLLTMVLTTLLTFTLPIRTSE